MQSFSNKSSFPFRNAKRFIRSKSSFTLIELLIVIGILAILTAAVVIVLNPTELLKQGRDSTRMTDLASLSKTIQLLLTQNPSLSLGTASTVYISLPDTSSTCTNLSLPTLPAGYTYHCVPTASSTFVNGSGWIPIDFTTSGIQNFSKLPLDPINTSSTGMYYVYTPGTNNLFELNASVESNKYVSRGGSDGGISPLAFEVGSSQLLIPPEILGRGATYAQLTSFDSTLIGYWPFDEGSGLIAYDRSGGASNGTINNTLAWGTGKVGNYSLDFSPSQYGIGVQKTGKFNLLENNNSLMTVAAWVYYNSLGGTNNAILENSCCSPYKGFTFITPISSGKLVFSYDEGSGVTSSSNMPLGRWVFVSFTNNGQICKIFFDGVLNTSSSCSGILRGNGLVNGGNMYIGTCNDGGGNCPSWELNGYIDDVRIYNRALSDQEILTIYNATR